MRESETQVKIFLLDFFLIHVSLKLYQRHNVTIDVTIRVLFIYLLFFIYLFCSQNSSFYLGNCD